ncbi:MAG: dihydrodipicolinate synthase family protein [Roseiflexaceae bacterium]
MPALFAALLTPFSSSTGAVDHGLVPAHLRWLERNGVHGVVVCGTTGEAQSLGLDERRALIDTVLEHRGGLRVVAGTGCAALPETIALTRYAIEQGAESALVLPPFYFKGVSDTGLLGFYRAVCDALPDGGRVMLYHIPPMSQIAISPALIAGLLESHLEAICGLKDSGGDPAYSAGLIERFPSLQIYTGGALLLARALADGAAGGIFALANVFPRELRAVIDAHTTGGDTQAAQQRVAALNEAIKPAPVIPALKALLAEQAGLPLSSARVPLVDLSEPERLALLGRVRRAEP